MKVISSIQEAWGDRVIYQPEESEIVMCDYWTGGSGDDRRCEKREAVMEQKNYSTQPAWVKRDANNIPTVEMFHSCGD